MNLCFGGEILESRKRSILKTLTWRVIAFCVTTIVIYAYNKSLHKSFIMSLIANSIKMLLYYIHERIWNHISFGRKKPEYNI